MARIQRKSSGRRQVSDRLDAASLRAAINAALEKKGIALPRFGGDLNLGKGKKTFKPSTSS